MVSLKDSYRESVAISVTIMEETVCLQGPVLIIRSQDQHKWNVKQITKPKTVVKGTSPKNICYSHNFAYVLYIMSFTYNLRPTAMLKEPPLKNYK